MILADKILSLRKESNWSQEELAEKLNVSRQSISKWESAASIPDISKIIAMADLFSVTTDYLLKDDLEQTVYTQEEPSASVRIGIEAVNAFVSDRLIYGKKIALGVAMCIISPVLLIVLPVLLGANAPNAALLESREDLGAGVGLVVLFLLVAAAVTIFILSSSRVKKYQYIEQGEFELSYGVEGILRERLNAYEPRYSALTATGVALCILSPIPLIVAGLADANDSLCTLFTGLLLLIVAAAVYIFIASSTEKECYDQLLREEDFSDERKEAEKFNSKLSGVYWPVVTAAYLIWSFLSDDWEITWLIWPVAGILFGAICAVAQIIHKPER